MLPREYDRGAPVVTLAVVSGDEPDQELTAEFASRFLGLEFTDAADGADKFILRLDNNDLALLDDHRLSHGQILRASWGYMGAMTPPRDFVVKSVKGMLELTVEGHGMMTLMHREPKLRVWDGRRASQIVTEIARSYGYDGAFLHVEDSAVTLDHVQQRETDAQLVKRLANRLRWMTYTDHTGFHFHPRRLDMPAIRQYSFRAETEGSHPGGDIVDQPRVESDLAGKAGLIKLVGRDPVTGESWEVRASNDDTSREGLGQVVEVVDPAKASGRVMERVSRSAVRGIPGTRATAEQEARGEYILSALGNYELSLTVIGDPAVAAKQIVEVWGISSYLSGRYFVKECKTTFAAGDYTQRLKLTKDASGRKEAQVAEASAAAQGQGREELSEVVRTEKDANGVQTRHRYYYRNGVQIRDENLGVLGAQ